MIYRGVSNINNYNSLWLLVYKKLRIIQSYPQPFLKASTNSHRLRNLYLALSKGLTAKKIKLYGVFYLQPHYCYKRLVVCRYIYNRLCCQGEGGEV